MILPESIRIFVNRSLKYITPMQTISPIRLFLPFRLFTAFLLLFPLSGKSQTAGSLMDEGIQLFDSGSYQEALAKYQQALKLDPENAHILYEIANTYAAMEEYKDAIKYAEKVIDKGKSSALGLAYMIKGNALDGQGKPEKAIQAYRDGIKSGEPNNMLHFNLAICLGNQKQVDEAIGELEKAIDIKPEHASSHYVLGLLHYNKDLRVKPLLSLYYFLLLENKSARAKNAWAIVQKVSAGAGGVEKTGERALSINMNAAAMNDEFGTVELAIPLHLASKKVEETDSLKTSPGTVSHLTDFAGFNAFFFQLLDEQKDKKEADSWWNFYTRYFMALHTSGHTEAFSYYLAFMGGDKDASQWLLANESKLTAFADWSKTYKP